MSKTFIEGMILKQGHFHEGNAHLKVAIKIEDFAKFVKENQDNGWLNIEIKTSKAGKIYAELDTWKPDRTQTPPTAEPEQAANTPEDDDSLPF